MSMLTIIKAKLGQAANTAYNFLLDASAADGTLKLLRESGQQIMDVGADGKVTFPQNVQTWQNLLTSRAIGTWYTNSGGQPIKVSVSVTGVTGATTPAVSVTVGGEVIAYTTLGYSNGTVYQGYTQSIFFEVPAGTSYRLSNASGSNTLSSWMELR